MPAKAKAAPGAKAGSRPRSPKRGRLGGMPGLEVLGGIAVVAVLLLLVAGVWSATHRGKSSPSPSSSIAPHPAPDSVVAAATTVDPDTMAAIGAAKYLGWPQPAQSHALSENGKPLVFYAGADYCSYCGVERWALVRALSRFGTFSDLAITESAPNEDFPHVLSLSFYGSNYSSPYVAFNAIELYTNLPQRGIKSGYTALETPTAEQQAILNKYDTPPYLYDDGIPFIDFGGKYLQRAPQFSPAAIQGLSFAQLSDGLTKPTGTVSSAINGSANILTAVICNVTGEQPSSVCATPLITGLEQELAKHKNG